jgi:hypothetical protein
VSVARNFIGWNPSAGGLVVDYDSDEDIDRLETGDRVRIVEGAGAGDVYEYVGTTIEDGDANTAGEQAIELAIQNYGDITLWKPLGLTSSPAQVQAFIDDSSILSSGALTVDAQSEQTIQAVVVAGAVALAGGGSTGVGVSGAGVYTNNRIRTLVRAFIDGDGAGGISADSVSLTAEDTSAISAVAGAASLAGSVGGTTGVSVSIGLALSFNAVNNDVAAFIANADTGVTATSGDVTIAATSSGQDEFGLDLGVIGLTANQLNDAAEAAQDDSESALDEALQDANLDATTLQTLANALAAQIDDFPAFDTLTHATFGTGDGLQTVKRGDTVKLAADYAGLGVDGAVYRYVGTEAARDLDAQNYTDTSFWRKAPPLRISTLEDGKGWSVLAGDGSTYALEVDDADPDQVKVSRTTINAVSAAASVALGFGGTAGVAFAGAGAVSHNEVLTRTNAYIDLSRVTASDDVTLDAQSSSAIDATVAAAAVAVGGGGTAGVGAAIGVSVARNLIGDATDDANEVAAWVSDSAVSAGGDLSVTAIADQTIGSVVLAGAAAVGVGGTAGVGFAGSGVFAENAIAVDVAAYIDGDLPIGGGETSGIKADNVLLSAQDTSTISTFAGAASLALSLGGTAGVSVSIGVALAHNTITSTVGAWIENAGDGVETTTGDVRIEATETASIRAVAAAASLAAGFGGVAGVAVSGAGAEATNIILADTNAYIKDSVVDAADDVDIDAENSASIEALIASASFSASIGGTAGVGASIGVALARNFIGWDPDAAVPVNHTTDAPPLLLTTGKTVKIKEGARAGDVYKYIGSSPLLATDTPGENFLLRQDYGDRTRWEQVNLVKNAADVRAYVENSSVDADGDLTLDAVSDQRIEATVLAGSVAISGGTVGVALSGAGASAANRIATQVQAFIDRDRDAGATGITAHSVALKADDTSVIDALVGAASIGAGVGAVGVSLSIGVGLAFNEISNEVSAFIRDADGTLAGPTDAGVITTGGGITVEALEDATIHATAAAASASAALGAVAVSLSGAGAFAFGVILTDTEAFVEDSVLDSAGGVLISAVNDADIDAEVIAASASLTVGGVAGVGASIGAAVAKNLIGRELDGTPASSTVHAYILNASVEADGDLELEALSTGSIDAVILSGSVAVSGGGLAGIGLSGAGASVENVIAASVKAYIDGDGALGIHARDVQLTADDTSTITATAGSASVAAAFGTAGVSVSVGVGLARNTITNEVEAFIRNADNEVSTEADFTSAQTSVALSRAIACGWPTTTRWRTSTPRR